jgi:hypothetical protein
LLTAQAETLSAQAGRLQARVEDLERRAGRDSSTSSRPPSSDNPYKKKGRDRSSRERGKRRPGRQPGDPGSFGPEVSAQAANLTAGHHTPVHRATLLLCQLAGITVSTGWMAGIRGRAAALTGASGFMERSGSC